MKVVIEVKELFNLNQRAGCLKVIGSGGLYSFWISITTKNKRIAYCKEYKYL